MASFCCANRLILRCLTLFTLILIVLNEIILYDMNQASWKKIDCELNNCTRILFVADPQLIGNQYEHWLFKFITKLDADRYLKKTFERASISARPHIICFLGDLLDEGNIATTEEFQEYVERFYSIYKTDNSVQYVHVPGDNDIGGENGEYISNSNVRRFEKKFAIDDLFDYGNSLRFFKINRMMLDFTNPDQENNMNRLRIGVSHMPIVIGGESLLRSVVRELDPHVIFSGHWHESRFFLHPTTKVINFYENDIRNFDLKNLKEQEHSYLEIMVPTASYRMGTTKIGMGLAVIENYKLHYTVLWFPNRFILLFVYLFWILFVICCLIVSKMMTSCPFRMAKRQYNRLATLPPI